MNNSNAGRYASLGVDWESRRQAGLGDNHDEAMVYMDASFNHQRQPIYQFLATGSKDAPWNPLASHRSVPAHGHVIANTTLHQSQPHGAQDFEFSQCRDAEIVSEYSTIAPDSGYGSSCGPPAYSIAGASSIPADNHLTDSQRCNALLASSQPPDPPARRRFFCVECRKYVKSQAELR